MDEAKVDGLRSRSPEDLSRPSKYRKIDKSKSSNLNTSGNGSIQKTDGSSLCQKIIHEKIYSRLLEIEADEKLLEEERNQLKIQMQVNTKKMARLQKALEKTKRDEKEVIAQLQEDLKRSRKDREEAIAHLQRNVENLMRDLEEARRSQEFGESKLSQLKTIMEQQIMPLVIGSRSEYTSTASQFQEKGQESVPEGLAEVTLRNDSISQEKLNTQDIPLTKSSVAIQTITPENPTDGEMKALEAKAKRVDELEEELQIAKATISSLHEVRSQQQSSMQERIDEAEKVRQQIKILEKKLEMSSSKICEDASMHDSSGGGDVEMFNLSGGGDMELANSSGRSFSSVAPDHSSTLLDQHHNEAQEASSEEQSSSSDGKPDAAEESSVTPMDEDQRTDDLPMFFGRKRSILVTSSKFFKLNWDDEFTRTEEKEWICKRCSRFYTSKQRMEDHVWNVHHDGKFQCPQCTQVPRYFSSRSATTVHIQKEHTPPNQGHNEAQEASEEESSSSDDEPEPDVNEESVIPEADEERANDSRIWIGRKYSILISPGFFDMDWNEEFTQTKSKQFICKTCAYPFSLIEAMKDHVWNVHHGGTFKCTLCTDSASYISRQSVRQHIRLKHQDL